MTPPATTKRTSSLPELVLDLLALASSYNAGQAWTTALDDAISHVILVVQNNPLKPLSQILKRPDVREALSWPFARAGAETLAAVREAWLDAAGDTVLPDADLKAIVANVKKNTLGAPVRLRQAMAKGPRDQMSDRLYKLADDLVRRAEFAVEYSGKRATTLKQLAEAPKTAQKTWRRDPESDSCKWCIELDGTTIGIKQVFVVEGLKSFRKLVGPPLHPRCACHLDIT